jgi:hypothetical protein
LHRLRLVFAPDKHFYPTFRRIVGDNQLNQLLLLGQVYKVSQALSMAELRLVD